MLLLFIISEARDCALILFGGRYRGTKKEILFEISNNSQPLLLRSFLSHTLSLSHKEDCDPKSQKVTKNIPMTYVSSTYTLFFLASNLFSIIPPSLSHTLPPRKLLPKKPSKQYIVLSTLKETGGRYDGGGTRPAVSLRHVNSSPIGPLGLLYGSRFSKNTRPDPFSGRYSTPGIQYSFS